MLEHAQQDGAPRLTRARVGRLLRADPARMDAQLRESVRAQDSRALQAAMAYGPGFTAGHAGTT